MNIQAMRLLIILAAAGVLTQIRPSRGSLIDLTVSDATGRVHTVSMGVHSSATDTMDYVLGELPVPPPPSESSFDVRFLNGPGHPPGAGTGSYVDIRPYHFPGQIDSFIVNFRTEVSDYPMEFTFTGTLDSLCDSVVVLLDRQGVQERASVTGGGWRVGDPRITRAMIIRHGVKFP
jgi:hypothetical protein